MAKDHGCEFVGLGWQLRLYLAIRPWLQPLMRRLVARRVARGKDHSSRAQEKFGYSTQQRPEGHLVWCHAVGLGEVLALRPLLSAMGKTRPDVHFLVTSTARSSGQVLSQNLPPRVIHQFLPLDGPDFVARFLDHWQPDVSIWSEQDLWPGAICDVFKREIPLAYINARLTKAGFEKRRKLRSGYRNLMKMFKFVAAQDDPTVRYLSCLGAASVQKMASLKPAATPLSVDEGELAALRASIAGRRVWLVASSHAPDEKVALAGHVRVLETDPSALMIVVPREPDRGDELCAALQEAGLRFARRSRGQSLSISQQVFVADTIGELGLWYRLAQIALIGGSYGETEGHNPWEAVTLGCPVLSGPNTDNFASDYELLQERGLAKCIARTSKAPEHLAVQVLQAGCEVQSDQAEALVASAREAIMPLARKLLALLPNE